LHDTPEFALASRRYREIFGARLNPIHRCYFSQPGAGEPTAVLGYTRAGEQPLFLERYLDVPVETAVGEALGRDIVRDQIVELGNFAASNAMAMIALWGEAANDLGGSAEVAVATLTAPLREMFRRIGLPIRVLAPAQVERAGAPAEDWGHYYSRDPMVCAGLIVEGQAAISRFLARRNAEKAA